MKTLGFLYAIGTAVLWGLVYAIDEKVLTKVSPLMLLFVHAALTLIILLPFVFMRAHEFQGLFTSGRSNLLLIATTVILGGLSNILIYSSIQKIGATTASMIEIAYPLFVALFGALMFARGLSLSVMFGGLLVLLGSLIIIKWS